MRRSLAIIMSVSAISVLAACSSGNSQEAEVKAWSKELLEMSRDLAPDEMTDAEYQEALASINSISCEDPKGDTLTCTSDGEKMEFGINEDGEITIEGQTLDENLELMKGFLEDAESMDLETGE